MSDSPSPESRKKQLVVAEEENGGENHSQTSGGMNGISQEESEAGSTAGGNGVQGGGDGGPPRSSLEPASAIKMLVSASLAGCLIGKGGSTIHDLQERTGARIKLSQNNDFFPGTQDRIVLISGEVETVPHALSLVIEHLHASATARNTVPGAATDPSAIGSTSVKLLVAKGAGGLLIGRGGATIKTLNEEAGARIQLAAKDEAAGVVTGERVVTISGPLDGVLKGVHRIIEKLNEEPELSRYQNLTTSYSRSTSAAHPLHPAFDIPTYHTQSFGETQLFSPGNTGPGMIPRGMMGPPPPPPPPPQAQGQPQTLTLQVPDKLIGSILGKGGQTLKEMQQQSGARITISKRGEYAPGTQNRVVTIEGPAYGAELARNMVSVKVQQSLAPPGTY